jgi:hypothetical protein
MSGPSKKSEPWLRRQARYLIHPLTKAAHHANTDVYVVSYPKCGRTWLRMMLCSMYSARAHLPAADLEVLERGREWGLPNLGFTHDGAAMAGRCCTAAQLKRDKKRYRSKKVVFLARDVRDALTSSYFHATKRIHVFTGTPSEFVRADKLGAGKIITFYNIWAKARNVPHEFMLVRYEDLKQDTTGGLRRVLEFLGITPTAEELQAALEVSSVDNMRKLERANAINHPALRPGDVADINSYKVRRGVVGGHAELFNAEDIAFMNGMIERELDPFFGYTSR